MDEKHEPPKKKEASLPSAKVTTPLKKKEPPKPKKVERLLDASVQMYRTKMPVSKGKSLIRKGELISLDWLSEKGIKQLEKIGAVRPVLSPPLAKLAGWKTRATRLEPYGVITVADFLTVPEDDLARVLRVKKQTILTWQELLREWSRSEIPPNG
jgi:hypothetical protein